MSAERALLVFSETTAAMEDLQIALQAMGTAPWKPVPEGARFGSPQERYSDDEVDAYVLTLLRRSIGEISFGGSVIVP